MTLEVEVSKDFSSFPVDLFITVVQQLMTFTFSIWPKRFSRWAGPPSSVVPVYGPKSMSHPN